MSKKRVGFQEQVRRCVAEVEDFLPELAERHSPLTVLAALTEHVGGGLLLCQETGACTPDEARAIIRRIQELTFAAGRS